jgi:deazaflavin-dependent oxidoreductase (nitroreductase family)
MTRPARFPPRSLKVMNKVIVWLQRRGVSLPMSTLTVPGRRTGTPRSTPVSPYEVNGQRYVVGGHGGSDWVKNARAAGTGVLARGRHSERIRMVDLPEAERGAILREFPAKVPHGVAMFIKTGTVTDASPEAFEAAAPRCAVFRIDPAE